MQVCGLTYRGKGQAPPSRVTGAPGPHPTLPSLRLSCQLHLVVRYRAASSRTRPPSGLGTDVLPDDGGGLTPVLTFRDS